MTRKGVKKIKEEEEEEQDDDVTPEVTTSSSPPLSSHKRIPLNSVPLTVKTSVETFVSRPIKQEDDKESYSTTITDNHNHNPSRSHNHNASRKRKRSAVEETQTQTQTQSSTSQQVSSSAARRIYNLIQQFQNNNNDDDDNNNNFSDEYSSIFHALTGTEPIHVQKILRGHKLVPHQLQEFLSQYGLSSTETEQVTRTLDYVCNPSSHTKRQQQAEWWQENVKPFFPKRASLGSVVPKLYERARNAETRRHKAANHHPQWIIIRAHVKLPIIMLGLYQFKRIQEFRDSGIHI